MRIFIIDDDELFADCVKAAIYNTHKALETEIQIYKNAIDAINHLDNDLPDLIFLDILLPGPDGFTFLNEIASYTDTAKIPVVLVTSLDLEGFDLKLYGVKGILNKEKMKPKDVVYYVERYTN